MPSRRTMAPVCRLLLPRWQRRPFIWSNTLRKCHWTAPMPCRLKRRRQIVGHEDPSPTPWDPTRNSRRPTKVGSRDRKVARDRALCIGMSAGMMRIATMVEERPYSTLDERHLHRGWPVDGKTRSFQQAVVVTRRGVETSDRGCRSTTGTRCVRVLSVGMRSGRLRIQ